MLLAWFVQMPCGLSRDKTGLDGADVSTAHTSSTGQGCQCRCQPGLEEQGTYSHFLPSSTLSLTPYLYVRATTSLGYYFEP